MWGPWAGGSSSSCRDGKRRVPEVPEDFTSSMVGRREEAGAESAKAWKLGGWFDGGWAQLPAGLAGWPCTSAGRGASAAGWALPWKPPHPICGLRQPALCLWVPDKPTEVPGCWQSLCSCLESSDDPQTGCPRGGRALWEPCLLAQAPGSLGF